MPRKLTCSLKRSHFKIVKDRLPSHYCFKPTCQKLRFYLRIKYPRFFQKKKKRDQPQLLAAKKGEKNTNSPGVGWAPGRFGPSTSVDNAGAWRSATSCPSSLFYRRFSEKSRRRVFRIFGVLGCWCSWSLGFIQLKNPNEATQTLRELMFVSFCKIGQLVHPCKGIQVDVVQV